MTTANSDALLNHLYASGVLSDPRVADAFTAVDRADFVPKDLSYEAHYDYPISIGYGQTISQPSTVAFMLGLLGVEPGNSVLDIGSGSGWTTALLAHLTGKTGYVTGLEIVPELVTFGRGNLSKYRFANALILPAKASLGLRGNRFDRILVSAAAEEFPTELLDQLNDGGKLLIPVRNSIWSYSKDAAGNVSSEEYPGFVFVPLVTDPAPHMQRRI